jgi:hypothetical protein
MAGGNGKFGYKTFRHLGNDVKKYPHQQTETAFHTGGSRSLLLSIAPANKFLQQWTGIIR